MIKAGAFQPPLSPFPHTHTHILFCFCFCLEACRRLRPYLALFCFPPNISRVVTVLPLLASTACQFLCDSDGTRPRFSPRHDEVVSQIHAVSPRAQGHRCVCFFFCPRHPSSIPSQAFRKATSLFKYAGFHRFQGLVSLTLLPVMG